MMVQSTNVNGILRAFGVCKILQHLAQAKHALLAGSLLMALGTFPQLLALFRFPHNT